MRVCAPPAAKFFCSLPLTKHAFTDPSAEHAPPRATLPPAGITMVNVAASMKPLVSVSPLVTVVLMPSVALRLASTGPLLLTVS